MNQSAIQETVEQSPCRTAGALYIRLLCGVMLLAGGSHATAQNLPVHSYTTRDGLPSDNVTALCQDSRGFLLIGTDNGLSIYNGASFTTIGMAEGLPNSYITSIVESRKRPGTYWVGTIAGGLVHLDGDSLRIYRAGSNNIWNVYEDPPGNVWCINDDSLYVLRGDTLRWFEGIFDLEMFAALDDTTLLLTDGKHLSRLSPSIVAPLPLRPPLAEGETIAMMMIDTPRTLRLALSSGDVLEVGTEGTVVRRDSVGFRVRDGLPSFMARDRSGNLWLTSSSGLVSFAPSRKPGHPISSRRAPGVSGPLLVDRENIVWAGGPGIGLMKISDCRLQHIPVEGMRVGFYNQMACSDTGGTIWVAADAGVSEVRRTEHRGWTARMHGLGAPRGTTGQLLVDPHARLWIGDGGGPAHYACYTIRPAGTDGSTLLPTLKLESRLFAGYWSGFTFAVVPGERGWFTLGRELALVDIPAKRLIRRFGAASGLPADEPRALLMDRSGTFWSGSWSTGLSRLPANSDHFETFSDFAGIPGAGVRSLLQDAEGTIWIGTRFGGLSLYRNGVFRSVTVRDGLMSNAIWSLAETRHRIWVGTDVGLQSVDKQTLKPDPPQEELRVGRVYATGAYRDLFVWFTTAEDVVVLESPEEDPVAVSPLIQLTSFTADGSTLDLRTHHTLSPEQTTCVFEFVGINFRNDRGIRYEYRMIGLDTAWSEPRHLRNVTFAALKPGEYRFEVRALSAAGVASTTPAVLTFAIAAPYWQRWWFLSLGAGLFLALVFGLYRYRVERLLEMERLRTRIAADLHDDVGTNLSSIMLASEIIERDLPAVSLQRQRMSELRSRAGSTQEMLKDIVWLLNPRNDRFEDFLLKLKELARRQLVTVPCTFTVSGESRLDRLPLEFKRTIVLFLKEAITNVAKHAQATRVQVDLTFGDDRFSITIADNGKGFDPAVKTDGDGLPNLRARAHHLGGTLEIAGAPGKGTTIRLLSAHITYTRSIKQRKTSVS